MRTVTGSWELYLESESVMLEGTVTKLQAAGIIHDVLISKMHEADDPEWEQALLLKDIYDCSRCVGHVAQVYVKGIILPKTEDVFGTTDVISESEKAGIIDRLWHVERRVKPVAEPLHRLSHIKVSDLSDMPENACFIDVRLPEEYEIKYAGLSWTNVTLEEIRLNPYCMGSDFLRPLVLRCNKGYMSGAASGLLMSHGYRKVYVLET